MLGLCLTGGPLADVAWRRSAWWVSLPLAALIALGAEGLVFAGWQAVGRRPTRYPRLPAHLAGLAATLAACLASGASGLAMAAAFCPALLYSFVRSLWAERGCGRRVGRARVAVVLALFGLGALRSHPVMVPTSRLVALSLLAPRDWALTPQNWVESELGRRVDAVPEIERRLASASSPAADPALPSRSELVLLRLHLLAGGAPGPRSERCSGWDLARYERHYAEGPPAAKVARLLCARP